MELTDYMLDLNQGFSDLEINNSVSTYENDFTLILDKLRSLEAGKNKLMFIGNGASASISSHMSLDYWKTAAIRTMVFNDFSQLTALSNDVSYDAVFSEAVKFFGESGDILVGISSSGNSVNILKAMDVAKEKNIFCITLSGMSRENTLRTLGDINIYFPGKTYGHIESAHAIILHYILDKYVANYIN
jgi:D-sedoheptulose 7-phosphate isomerase